MITSTMQPALGLEATQALAHWLRAARFTGQTATCVSISYAPKVHGHVATVEVEHAGGTEQVRLLWEGVAWDRLEAW